MMEVTVMDLARLVRATILTFGVFYLIIFFIRHVGAMMSGKQFGSTYLWLVLILDFIVIIALSLMFLFSEHLVSFMLGNFTIIAGGGV